MQLGPNGQPMGPPGPVGWIQSILERIGHLHFLTDGFARFSNLLAMNADAVHRTFASFIGTHHPP